MALDTERFLDGQDLEEKGQVSILYAELLYDLVADEIRILRKIASERFSRS
jgi:hypothetical protein